MSQMALPFPGQQTPESPDSLDDAALLSLFTPAGTALCEQAGSLRAALELPDAALERAGVDAFAQHRLRATLELGTRYVPESTAATCCCSMKYRQ